MPTSLERNAIKPATLHIDSSSFLSVAPLDEDVSELLDNDDSVEAVEAVEVVVEGIAFVGTFEERADPQRAAEDATARRTVWLVDADIEPGIGEEIVLDEVRQRNRFRGPTLLAVPAAYADDSLAVVEIDAAVVCRQRHWRHVRFGLPSGFAGVRIYRHHRARLRHPGMLCLPTHEFFDAGERALGGG